MRELRTYQNPDDYEVLIYDQEKDSSSEEAMWTTAKILYELKPGDVLKFFCAR